MCRIVPQRRRDIPDAVLHQGERDDPGHRRLEPGARHDWVVAVFPRRDGATLALSSHPPRAGQKIRVSGANRPEADGRAQRGDSVISITIHLCVPGIVAAKAVLYVPRSVPGVAAAGRSVLSRSVGTW